MRLCGRHALLVLVVVAGCGGGGQPAKPPERRAAAPPSPCVEAARATVARSLAVAPNTIATKTGTGNNGMPQCTFTASARHASVTANLDNSPQTYFRLERAIVEESQQFATVRQVAAPQHVAHLGLDASWFPAEHQLLTADKKDLITVIVSWRHARQARQRALAKKVARAYLTPVRRR
jgi:hypothetical protein